MKEKIHPKYEKVKVSCACGNEFETRSTIAEIKTEICSNCHPFFTGKQKLMDSAGRVEKFNKKFGRASSAEGTTAVKKVAAEKPAATKKTVEKAAEKTTAKKK